MRRRGYVCLLVVLALLWGVLCYAACGTRVCRVCRGRGVFMQHRCAVCGGTGFLRRDTWQDAADVID